MITRQARETGLLYRDYRHYFFAVGVWYVAFRRRNVALAIEAQCADTVFAMTNDIENLVLEQLRLIRNEVLTTRSDLRQDIQLLHQRMSVFEKHMAALVSSSTYHEERYAALESRMDRLETRLNLLNGETP